LQHCTDVHNPTSRQKLEPFCPIGAFDDFDLQMRQDFG
jgi:hypothetical protein